MGEHEAEIVRPLSRNVVVQEKLVVQTLRKKWLRYKDAEIVYSLEHKKILEMADECGAIYRREGTVLINRDIFDEYLERFHQPAGILDDYDWMNYKLQAAFSVLTENGKQLLNVELDYAGFTKSFLNV